MRNIPHSSMFHKSILKTLDTSSPNTFTASPAQMKVSIVFHDSYFLDGVYLSGGTPLVDLVEHLGAEGTLRADPLRAGWGASVEMIGLVDFLTLLSLSVVAGGVTLTIGVTGNIEFPFNWLKESEECAQNFPSKFHGCASACSLK